MTIMLRSLAQARGFTLTTVFTLGGGLALCVIVAAVANAYLVRPLPYPAADRLYSIQYAPSNQQPPRGLNAIDWSSLGDIVEHAIAWDLDMFYLLGGSYPEMAPGAWVTPGYVQGFGVRAALGRDLHESDFEPGRPPVALISHRLWQSRFGGNTNVIGQRLTVYVSDRPDEPESIEIVGVTGAEFWHVNPYTEVLAPLRVTAYPYMLQLREGVPSAVVEERLAALVQSSEPSAPRPALVAFQSGYVAAVRPVLWAIGAAAALVLVIACANVAVLMLVRSQKREREVMVRLALGASRAQVLRMLIAEALALGTAATAVGVTLAIIALRSLVPFVEGFLERRVPRGAAAIGFDSDLAATAIAIGLTATVAFSLIPAIGLWRQSLAPSIAAGARGTTIAGGRSRTRSFLIGLEVAVSLTLLAGALLMTISALRMLSVDFGIRAMDVTTAGITLRQQSYPDVQTRAAFFERLIDRLTTLSHGRTVVMGDWWPLQAPPRRQFETSAGTTVPGGAVGVSAGYFDTLGVRIIEGRAFDRTDRIGSEPVTVVSESLARRLFASTRAIGETLRISTVPQAERPETTVYRIIGVAADVRQTYGDVDLLDAYVPILQTAGRFAFVYFPIASPTPSWEREVRSAVANLDAEVGMGVPRALQSAIDQEHLKPRVLATMLSAFAVFAALLALLGMYGVVSYAVRQREREIAVRIAVGADRRSVTSLFVRQGGSVLAAGVLVGALGAIGMGRILDSELHGVGRADPLVIGSAAALLACCGLAAIWWPARRAAATDPAAVLKTE
ncbi:MAG TPA: ABC transporter permease [Vicinamibacterales bacterium]|nr:ABC transporter permease [Vicinamibacterales bacterium]